MGEAKNKTVAFLSEVGNDTRTANTIKNSVNADAITDRAQNVAGNATDAAKQISSHVTSSIKNAGDSFKKFNVNIGKNFLSGEDSCVERIKNKALMKGISVGDNLIKNNPTLLSGLGDTQNIINKINTKDYKGLAKEAILNNVYLGALDGLVSNVLDNLVGQQMEDRIDQIIDFTKNLALDIYDTVTDTVTNEVMAIESKVVALPNRIIDRSLGYFKDYVIPASVYLEEFTKKQDEENEKSTKEAETNKQNKKISKIKNTIKKIKDTAPIIYGYVFSYTAMALSYLEYGPQYIEGVANDILDIGKEKVSYYLQKETYFVDFALDTTVEFMGKQIGYNSATLVNKVTKAAADALMQKTERTKKQASVKAKAAISKATLKIMSMLGG